MDTNSVVKFSSSNPQSTLSQVLSHESIDLFNPQPLELASTLASDFPNGGRPPCDLHNSSNESAAFTGVPLLKHRRSYSFDDRVLFGS